MARAKASKIAGPAAQSAPAQPAPAPTATPTQAEPMPAVSAPTQTKAPDGAPTPDALATPPAKFPIVGIGASAGGLAAFESFFSGMPADAVPGMAFVLVQHLSPDHDSLLAELIRRYTRMPVFEVQDGMLVQPNCVYIIAPNRDLALINGSLQLLEPVAARGHRLPIDFFFRSLAQDRREQAIGIVLSGTGSDGVLGVRAIKGEAGMVMVQAPGTAQFDGMPRAAIATGLVDCEFAPAEMPARLISYVAQAFGNPHPLAITAPSKTETALKKIFILLRAQTSHDFSQYKPSTIHRRIERRMAVHQIDTLDSYVKYLQQSPPEVEALFRDMLIGVTSFFRDTEAFAALQALAVPQLFAGRSAAGVVRVWVAGCSTGEEAYSLAILLQEHMEAVQQNWTVQVFATDIDSRAIAVARAGLYPASIAADVSAQRLARYFTATPDGQAYQIHKSIRNLLVFSEHDLNKDPPFSKVDLISCRNLLIYLGAQLQKKVIPLFHYALNPRGVLFLGTSEGVGDFVELFSVLDRKGKIFLRRDGFSGAPRGAGHRMVAPMEETKSVSSRSTKPEPLRDTGAIKLPLRELAEQALLRQLAVGAALVGEKGDILYLHGRTGKYLEMPPGETGTSNILKMAREGLRHALTGALHQAVQSRVAVRVGALHVKTNGHYTTVNLCVSPVAFGAGDTPQHSLYLVVLEEAPVSEAARAAIPVTVALPEKSDGTPATDAESRILTLQNELRIKEEYLQTTHEELESSNEELKSSNEEMQSVNEELQSTNEELETSKEELQSVNEELSTVNSELQAKVVDLSRANNDMKNLMAGTGIATVFVDHQLHILRFTPSASAIMNLIQSDVGRPLGHLASNLLGYDRLVQDAQAVLNTLIPVEVEVQSKASKWYALRMQPYRTLDNVIEGAVITFVDVSEIVQSREALRQANSLLRLAVVVRDANDAICVLDLDGRIKAWNPGAERLYGWSEAQALQMNVRELIPEPAREAALERVRQLSHAEVLQPYFAQRLAKDGSIVEVSMVSTALLDAAGKMYAIATTERRRANASLGQGLDQVVDRAPEHGVPP